MTSLFRLTLVAVLLAVAWCSTAEESGGSSATSIDDTNASPLSPVSNTANSHVDDDDYGIVYPFEIAYDDDSNDIGKYLYIDADDNDDDDDGDDWDDDIWNDESAMDNPANIADDYISISTGPSKLGGGYMGDYDDYSSVDDYTGSDDDDYSSVDDDYDDDYATFDDYAGFDDDDDDYSVHDDQPQDAPVDSVLPTKGQPSSTEANAVSGQTRATAPSSTITLTVSTISTTLVLEGASVEQFSVGAFLDTLSAYLTVARPAIHIVTVHSTRRRSPMLYVSITITLLKTDVARILVALSALELDAAFVDLFNNAQEGTWAVTRASAVDTTIDSSDSESSSNSITTTTIVAVVSCSIVIIVVILVAMILVLRRRVIPHHHHAIMPQPAVSFTNPMVDVQDHREVLANPAYESSTDDITNQNLAMRSKALQDSKDYENPIFTALWDERDSRLQEQVSNQRVYALDL